MGNTWTSERADDVFHERRRDRGRMKVVGRSEGRAPSRSTSIEEMHLPWSARVLEFSNCSNRARLRWWRALSHPALPGPASNCSVASRASILTLHGGIEELHRQQTTVLAPSYSSRSGGLNNGYRRGAGGARLGRRRLGPRGASAGTRAGRRR